MSGVTAAAEDLILYDVEGNALCRRVRETITYLDLCCTIKPCADGSRHRGEAAALSAKLSLPCGIMPLACPSRFTIHLRPFDGGVRKLHRASRAAANSATRACRSLPLGARADRPTCNAWQITSAKPLKLIRTTATNSADWCARSSASSTCRMSCAAQARAVAPRGAQRAQWKDDGSVPLIDPNSGTAMGESADIVKYLLSQLTAPTPTSRALDFRS